MIKKTMGYLSRKRQKEKQKEEGMQKRVKTRMKSRNQRKPLKNEGIYLN